jgi:hypothetical protein
MLPDSFSANKLKHNICGVLSGLNAPDLIKTFVEICEVLFGQKL